MGRGILCTLLLLLPLLAESRYTEFRYGSFEIFTNVGDKEARELLNELEQLRHATGVLIGKDDPETVWPIRILHVKGKTTSSELKLGRDAHMATVSTVTPELRAAIVRLLIEDNARRMPESIEGGLVDLLSTLQVDRTKVTLGAPPAKQSKDWARLQMLSVDPAYSGKLRVLISSLQQGVDRETAYRNAFEQTPAQVEKRLEEYLKAGKFETVPFSSKPLDLRRQFYAREVDRAKAAVIEGDLALALGNRNEAIARYKAAGDTPEAKDGLGLAQLDSASLASATGPRALVEKSKLASTPAADKRALLLKAAEGNKRWAEPHILLAANESEPLRKLPHMKKVAELQPRNAKNWENLALLQEQVNQFTDAGKSWSAALRASVDDGEQARIQAAKARSEELRVAQQIAEKQAAKRKEEEELNAVRNKALAQIRAAEAKVNAGNQPVDKSKPLDWYQEEKPPARVTGNLFRVDCTGKAAKLHLRTAEETDVALLVVDPSKIVISGGGEKMFACGIQKPARTIVVLHNGKEGKKTGTTGEVLSIEIH